MRKISKLIGIDDFISSTPKGYNTVIGDMGSKLSGGQKQCIAIARALLKQFDILILDESSASIDYETEMILHKALNKLCKEKTIVIITHNPERFKDVKKVIVVEDGNVNTYTYNLR